MPEHLDDFVCDLQSEDFYLTKEDWDQVVRDSIDLDDWSNW